MMQEGLKQSLAEHKGKHLSILHISTKVFQTPQMRGIGFLQFSTFHSQFLFLFLKKNNIPPKLLCELHAVISMFLFQEQEEKQVEFTSSILTHVFYSL